MSDDQKNKQKIAVVLFNLGGPDAPENVEPFLMNFFMDKNIIRLPKFFRYFLARYISRTRSRREAKESYDCLGGASPLLKNTAAQAIALEQKLNQNEQKEEDHKAIFKVFTCMRYWHPMAHKVAAQVQNWQPDKIILLPLYPQFSTTTTKSSFDVWDVASHAIALDKIPAVKICCYPKESGFVETGAENIREKYHQCVDEVRCPPRVLFSAHGLPEKIIQGGDPYQWQCEAAAQAIVERLKIPDLDWQICYQSRVGPLKWIGPSLDEALEKAARDDVPVLIYPHAFTQEHVETLVELDIEYAHIADKLGIKGYYRAGTANVNQNFIGGLAKIVLSKIQQSDQMITSNENTRLCPAAFCQCPSQRAS